MNNSNEIVDIEKHKPLCRVCYKNYNFNNKMEMKEIYPKLPTAPPIEDQGQGYRLQKINEIQTFLEKEVETREALSKNTDLKKDMLMVVREYLIPSQTF